MSQQHPPPPAQTPAQPDPGTHQYPISGQPHPAAEPHRSALEKEFELERLILFSDAVFAIAITLVAIDIKFPEIPKGLSGAPLLHAFRPMFISFFAFTVSFLFIGQSWRTHLRLFRLLKTYDQGLVGRNLIFLFFIVTFPFTASSLRYMLDGIIIPIYLYMFNIAFVSIAQFELCRYMLSGKTKLAIEGEAAEKKYMYVKSKYAAISMTVMAILLMTVTIFYPGKQDVTAAVCALAILFLAYSRRKAGKYKPANISTR
ncbi:MAG TPA: TMEM175 family protein [Puia sp.]|jgi:uncharacterized membrane protein